MRNLPPNLIGNVTSVITSCEKDLLNFLRIAFIEANISTSWMHFKKVKFTNVLLNNFRYYNNTSFILSST